MPRKAREKDNYGLYHIYQQSQDERVIFRSEDDRRVFWKILTEASERYSFRLLGYCMIEPDQYHLLVQLLGCDISSLMKSINISFMRESGHEAGLFKDRYRSELIHSPDDLLKISGLLHERAQGRPRWNSFCTFDQQALKHAGVDFEAIGSENMAQDILAGCTGDSCLVSSGDVRRLLETEMAAQGLDFETVLQDLELRNSYIQLARRRSTLSLKEIGELFGGLSESSISKILRQSETAKPMELIGS